MGHAQNCLKINFAFDQKILNSKTKLKNYPLKSKNTFSPTRSVRIEIFILRNYLRNCPRIIFAFDHDFQNSKLKNDPWTISKVVPQNKNLNPDAPCGSKSVFFTLRGHFLVSFLSLEFFAKMIFGQFREIPLFDPQGAS